MTETQNRRSSLSGSFHAIKSALSGRQSLEKHHEQHLRYTKACRFGRNSSLDSTIVNRQNSSAPSTPPKPDTLMHNGNQQHALRKVSAPATTDHPPVDTDEEVDRDGCNPDVPRKDKTIRVRRLTSHLRPDLLLPRSQTAVGVSRRPVYSRLPTPSEPPRGELYSHTVYQREGRRSVLSSLGKRCTGTVKRADKGNQRSLALEEGRGERLAIRDDRGRMDESSVRGLLGQTPTFTSNPPLYNPQHQTIPVVVVRHPAARCAGRDLLSRGETNALDALTTQHRIAINEATPLPVDRISIGKERANINSQLLLHRFYQVNDHALNPMDNPSMNPSNMSSPKRVRLTKGFENLKAQDRSRPKQSTQPGNLRPRPEYRRPQKKEPSKQKENNTPKAHFNNQPHEASNIKEKGQSQQGACLKYPESQLPQLNARRSDQTKRMVEKAMPRQYWLGRFVTLTNAFHYEDSFNEPDIASGFEMPSSYSRPFQHSANDRASYRAKRAFMVLENVCVTEEASTSLREFRNSYTKRFGDRWMV